MSRTHVGGEWLELLIEGDEPLLERALSLTLFDGGILHGGRGCPRQEGEGWKSEERELHFDGICWSWWTKWIEVKTVIVR